MKNVSQVSKLSGVSVRTLHHYDAIGLLHPSEKTEAGYRLYDDAAISRLQTILLFRELEFPLAQIKEILDSPGYSEKEALRQQVTLLQMQKAHLEGLIKLAQQKLKGEDETMCFSAFDKTELEEYKTEAREKWGSTEAYRAYEEKKKTEDAEACDADGLMAQFARMGELKAQDAASEAVQKAVWELQQYITAHYYPCRKEILAGLGQMYAADPRFKANIDAAGGDGTAAFVSRAIAVYCK